MSGGPADLRIETTIEMIVANDAVAVKLDLKRVVTFPHQLYSFSVSIGFFLYMRQDFLTDRVVGH